MNPRHDFSSNRFGGNPERFSPTGQIIILYYTWYISRRFLMLKRRSPHGFVQQFFGFNLRDLRFFIWENPEMRSALLSIFHPWEVLPIVVSCNFSIHCIENSIYIAVFRGGGITGRILNGGWGSRIFRNFQVVLHTINPDCLGTPLENPFLRFSLARQTHIHQKDISVFW